MAMNGHYISAPNIIDPCITIHGDFNTQNVVYTVLKIVQANIQATLHCTDLCLHFWRELRYCVASFSNRCLQDIGAI